ncbi:GntR family transcriptional regulator [Devosia sp. 2618]|uniref:GntR family transcriptional regulator n=1 Tax=Devosia sp. 2618 TaxID=3156454 RepID=UPI003390F296
MAGSDTVQSTRGQSTYRAILAAIREGVYKPGDRLREEEVAQRLEVSRTPVREAFGRLQEKGLLEPASGRGLAVAVLSMQEIFELYALRQELEGLIARFAAQHATDIEVAHLERINAEFAVADTAIAAAKLNRAFHARLYDCARNRYLRTAVEDLQETISLLPNTTFMQRGRTRLAAAEHAAIIDAIKERDAERAGRAGLTHIQQALQARLALTESDGA